MNKLPTSKASSTTSQSVKSESKDLKIHVRLFSKMCISTQSRGGNMLQFFNHATLPIPQRCQKLVTCSNKI